MADVPRLRAPAVATAALPRPHPHCPSQSLGVVIF
jgi:hypothetical protein